MASLYEKLGGEAAITAAVTDFYERVMADPTLSPFFEHIAMDAQIDKQIAFMTMAFGGPHEYEGRDLRSAHAGLVRKGLADEHFDAVAHHLGATLDGLGVPSELRDEALGIVAGTRDDVLGRPTEAP
jgi:hemoglobin